MIQSRAVYIEITSGRRTGVVMMNNSSGVKRSEMLDGR